MISSTNGVYLFPFGASSIGPASGFAVAALYLYGRRFWPVVLAGALVLGALAGWSWPALGLAALGGAWGAVAGAWVLREVLAASDSLEHQTETAAFVAASLVTGSLSAVAGVLGRVLLEALPWRASFDLFANWALGNALGVLVVAPSLILLAGPARRRVDFRKVAVTSLVVLGAAVGVFACQLSFEWLFLFLPLLLAVTFYGGGEAVKLASFCLASVGFLAAARGFGGPLLGHSPGETYLQLQVFLALIALTALALSGFRAVGSLRLAGGTLAVGWLFSMGLYHSYHEASVREEAQRIRAMADDGARALQDRMDVYADALHGVVGLYASRPRLDRAAWFAYVERLGILHRYRGLFSLGTMRVLSSAQAPAFVREMRADGAPDFKIQTSPGWDTGPYYVLQYVTGPEGERTFAEGADVRPMRARRAPADLSRDTGLPALSGSLVLTKIPGSPAALALTVPLYAAGLPIHSVDERRRALRGFAFGMFVTDEYLRDALGSLLGPLEMDLYDGDTVAPERRIFTSAGTASAYEVVRPLEIAQHHYVLAWRRGAGFSPRGGTLALWAGCFGGLVSLLIAALIINLQLITHRARAMADHQTARLRESQSLLAALLDHLPLAIYCKAVRPGFPILFWNRHCERIFGRKREAVVGRGASDIFPPAEAATANANDEAAIAAGGNLLSLPDLVYDSPEFGRIQLHTRKCVVEGADGKPEFILGISEDITARVRNKQSLIEAREAALDAARAKSEFLANMSHELRTPLNAVIGLSGLLQQSNLPSESRELARVIRQSGDALLTVINDILDYSKVEVGEMQLDRVDWNVRELVIGTSEILAQEASIKGLQLDVKIAPEVPPIVSGDPRRVRQVLLNLMNNAIKFTARGQVQVAVTGVSTGPGNLTLRLEVSDSGIGIPESARDRLFQAFSQVNSSTTRQYGGTGLGLSICKRLVQLMGGEIGFTSREGFGSVFWFTIPITARATELAEHPPWQSPAVPERAAYSVLVAEDNTANELVIRAVVEQLGYRVTVVPDGEEALRAVQTARPDATFDLILLDCRMPVLDGYQTARAIREFERGTGRRVPIFALSAHGAEQERQCLESGMDGFLGKPIDVELLARTLRQHVDDRYAPPPLPEPTLSV